MLKLISIIKKSLIHPSVIILLLVNIIPMAGVIYFSWDVFAIMILYWLESVIVGFLNVVRMIKINNNSLNSKFIPFFIVHFTIFMFVYLFFILSIFKPHLNEFNNQVEGIVSLFKYFSNIFISFSLLFLSHGISFAYNFVYKKEYKKINLKKQMLKPYRRIVIMHFVLIFSSIIMTRLNITIDVSAILVLVVLKIFFDLISHIKEHYSTTINLQ